MPQTRSDYVFQWQDQRKRKDGPHNVFLRGYGDRGDFQFSVASPVATHRYEFKNGEPTRVMVPSVLDDPKISDARKRIIVSLAAADNSPAKVMIDVALAEYSAALLLLSYKLSDEELEML